MKECKYIFGFEMNHKTFRLLKMQIQVVGGIEPLKVYLLSIAITS